MFCTTISSDHRSRSRSAFTIFELVAVLAILGIIAGISIGVLSNHRAEAKVNKAKADLQVIQIGLEAYRARFGDYPRVPADYTGLDPVNTPEEYLLNALNGRIGPAHQKVTGIPSMLNNSVLDMGNPSAGLPLTGLKNNWIVDPWGHKYVYDYRPGEASWLLFGYTLRSAGPDGVIAGGSDEKDDVIAK